MKKFLIGAGAAAVLAISALAPSAASANSQRGWHGGHGGPTYGHHGHSRGHNWGWKRSHGYAGYRCPRVPVRIFTAYGPAVKYVRSCNVYY